MRRLAVAGVAAAADRFPRAQAFTGLDESAARPQMQVACNGAVFVQNEDRVGALLQPLFRMFCDTLVVAEPPNWQST